MNYYFIVKTAVRLMVSIVIGSLIGIEREKHGRAAGIRTHILVCLGSALTSLMSIFISEMLGASGDVFRISAQVISGIGFLGAGMIILKGDNVITGLTTAAGVWATAIIGIAVGYGFYSGAVLATTLFLSAIIFFSKLERRKKNTELVYIEVDDMYKTNEIIKNVISIIGSEISYNIVAPKSGCQGHLGIIIVIEKRLDFEMEQLCKIQNVVYAQEE